MRHSPAGISAWSPSVPPRSGRSLPVREPAALDDRTLDTIGNPAGDPLIVRELVLAYLDRGTVGTTETVEQLIATRIDRLPSRARTHLPRARGLRHRCPDRSGRRSPGDGCRQLDLWAFLEPGGDDVRFRHELLRSVAYEGLSHRRRRELPRPHRANLRRAADPSVALVARHFLEAQQWSEAWDWSRHAADDAAPRTRWPTPPT